MSDREKRIWKYGANLTVRQLAERLVDAEDKLAGKKPERVSLPTYLVKVIVLNAGMTTASQFIECQEEDTSCPHTRECANHMTAGDFRSEDGSKPDLQNDVWHCSKQPE